MQKKPNTKQGSGKIQNKNSNRGSKMRKTLGRSGSSSEAVVNDPSWYAMDPVLLNDAARIPFSYPSGLPIPTATNSRAYNNLPATIPGIMMLNIVPTIGYSDCDSDPVNMAATQLYAFVRHCNSGSVNYDSGDLMLYLLGMADVYSALEWLRRMYGVAQLYSQSNRYLPKSLLRCMGVDPESMIDNLANFRYKFNILVNKAASFAVPATMSIFPRRAFLYQGVYTEGSSPKDQLYMYNPDGFYAYDWKNSKLKYFRFTDPNDVYDALGVTVEMGESGYTIDSLLSMVNAMIDVIISNEDMGTMNGDIIKAYGDNTIKLSHLSEDYYVAPAFDAYVLEQMQNATVLDALVSDNDIVSNYVVDASGVKTGTSILTSRPTIQNQSFRGSDETDYKLKRFFLTAIAQRCVGKQMIVTELPNPEPKDIMEITRLTSVIEPLPDDDSRFALRCGTEYVRSILMVEQPYGYNKDFPYSWLVTGSLYNYADLYDLHSVQIIGTDGVGPSLRTFMNESEDKRKRETVASAFKYCPTVYQYDAARMYDSMLPDDISDTEIYMLSLHADINAGRFSGRISNFAVTGVWELKKLHQTAILSEFATPHISIKPAK